MKKITLILSVFLLAVIGLTAQEQKDESIFRVVEEMPEFEGGQKELYKYLGQNLIYPEDARENAVQGTVYVQFVVRPDGSVSDVDVVRGVSDILDAEAVRVVKAMPLWNPGRQRGKEVAVYFTLPVKFKLEEPAELPEEKTE